MVGMPARFMIRERARILATRPHLAGWRPSFLRLHDDKQHQYAGTTSHVVSKKPDKSAMGEVTLGLTRHYFCPEVCLTTL